MSNPVDVVHTPRSTIHDLPGEILSHIFELYMALRPQPSWARPIGTLRSIKQLQLRLVCKRWADIIIARHFRVMDIRNPERLRALIANWTTLYASAPLYSENRCPVLKLTIDSVWYHEPDHLQCTPPETKQDTASTDGQTSSDALAPDVLQGTASSHDEDDLSPEANQLDSLSNPQEDDFDSIANPEDGEELADNGDSGDQAQWMARTQLCSMDATIQVLNLLGLNLTTLKITLVNSFGFPPAFVDAIRRMRFLQRLDIIYHYREPVAMGSYRKDTMIHLLQSVPQLQYLSLQCGEFLPDFTGSGLALFKLRTFSVVDLAGDSDEGILSLHNLIKPCLRSLELTGVTQNSNYVIPMLERVRPTLQALNVNREKLALVWNLEFPQLQVFGPAEFEFEISKTGLDSLTPENSWMHCWPLLRNVRTLAIAPKGCWSAMLAYFFDCWRTSNQKDSDALSTAHKGTTFKFPPSLRHIVFVPRFPGHIPLVFLKSLFAKHNIAIHAGDYAHLSDIDELDQILHAPMR